MADTDPRSWLFGTVAASLALALLDTLGVAAMIPLTQLLTGSSDGWFIDWIAGVVGTDAPSVLIPVVATIITAVFIAKSIGAIAFRWWLLGRTTRISALSSAELARSYALAPYAQHRSRRTERGLPQHHRLHDPGASRSARQRQHHHRCLRADRDHHRARDHRAGRHDLRGRSVRLLRVRGADPPTPPPIPASARRWPRRD